MVLDPSIITRPRDGEASNIVSGGGIQSEALPYVEFGGRLIGQSPGLSIAGRNSGFGGQLISLKDSTESNKIYSTNLKSQIDNIIGQKRGEGYSQQSATRLIKDLGGGTQSIVDIDPSSGNFSTQLFNVQQATNRTTTKSSRSSNNNMFSNAVEPQMQYTITPTRENKLIAPLGISEKLYNLLNTKPVESIIPKFSPAPGTKLFAAAPTIGNTGTNLLKLNIPSIDNSKNRVINHSSKLRHFIRGGHKW